MINLFEQHLHENLTKDLILSCIPGDEFLPCSKDLLEEFKDEVYEFVLKTMLGVKF